MSAEIIPLHRGEFDEALDAAARRLVAADFAAHCFKADLLEIYVTGVGNPEQRKISSLLLDLSGDAQEQPT